MTEAMPRTGAALATPAPAQPAATPAGTIKLAGWGANLRSDCVLVEPEVPAEVGKRLDRGGSIARGLGRSYGDNALNAGRQVIGTRRMDRYLAFNPETGVLSCEAGVSLERIIHDFAPRGWFPMITPGTKIVTIGGCIANDVHGKAHHAQGSFAESVEEMTLLLADGSVLRASRTENSDLFWGSFGGIGLLGIVLTATIRLRKIETTFFREKAVVAKDLDEMFAALEEHDKVFPYSVANLDVFARGKRLGRGVLAVGDHARRDELPPKLAKQPLLVKGPAKLTLPIEMPEVFLNPLSLRVLNALITLKQSNLPAYGHYNDFFYPLDIMQNWNRGYGRRGFTQYQFVIPFEHGIERMRAILEVIMSSGKLPFLNVLKRMGKQGQGILSFPTEGYTFAIDFPVRDGTVALLRKLDAMVLDAGGRVYLGKDSYVDADTFRKMYPGAIDRWLEVKHKYDPHNVFTSDMGRRVGLVP